MTRLLATLVLLTSACHDSDPAQPDAPPPDAPPDAPLPTVVAIENLGVPPIFIRFREGTGPWQTPGQTATGFEMRIFSEYELIAVCRDAAGEFDVGLDANTLAEAGTLVFVPCFALPATAAGAVQVSGTMVQPGRVTLSQFAESDTSDWSFQLAVPIRRHDLLATSASHAVLRRNLDIAVTQTLPRIDAVAEGQPLVDLPVSVVGADGDAVRTRTGLLTANMAVSATVVDSPGSVARLVPPALLVADDVQRVLVSASALGRFRSTSVVHTATSPTTFTLLPVLTGIAFSTSSASWTALPAGEVELALVSATTFTHVIASPGWLGGRSGLALPADIPGFLPEWRGAVDLADFAVRQRTGDLFRTTSISHSFAFRPAAQARLAAYRARRGL